MHSMSEKNYMMVYEVYLYKRIPAYAGAKSRTCLAELRSNMPKNICTLLIPLTIILHSAVYFLSTVSISSLL